jgi:hypothetical protein
MKLATTHLGDFFSRPEDVHKLLLKYAEEHRKNNPNNPFAPISFNPFDTILLAVDPLISHQILHGHQHAFKNRTSFPIIDYTYTRFMKDDVKSSLFNKIKDFVNPIDVNMGGVTFTNGEDWKRNRKMGVQLMGDRDFLLSSIQPILDCTDELIESWKSSSNEVDIGKGIGVLAIEVVGKETETLTFSY